MTYKRVECMFCGKEFIRNVKEDSSYECKECQKKTLEVKVGEMRERVMGVTSNE